MVALFWLIYTVLDIYFWILIASAVYSWLYAFNVINPRNQAIASIGQFLYAVTEPVLAPIRRRLPNLNGIDISPIVVIVLIQFLQIFLRTSVEPAVFSALG